MDDTTKNTERSETAPSELASMSRHRPGLGEAEKTGFAQTVYILVFRGYPRDTESARMVDFCIVANDNDNDSNSNSTDTSFRLEGERGSYKLAVTSDLGTFHSRPHFVRQFHVATVPVATFDDTRLRNLVTGICINNENPEWTRWTWVDNVLGALSAVGIITLEEGTEVLDATIDCVSDAPYPE